MSPHWKPKSHFQQIILGNRHQQLQMEKFPEHKIVFFSLMRNCPVKLVYSWVCGSGNQEACTSHLPCTHRSKFIMRWFQYSTVVKASWSLYQTMDTCCVVAFCLKFNLPFAMWQNNWLFENHPIHQLFWGKWHCNFDHMLEFQKWKPVGSTGAGCMVGSGPVDVRWSTGVWSAARMKCWVAQNETNITRTLFQVQT